MAEGPSVPVPTFRRSASIIRSLSHDEDPLVVKVEQKQGKHLMQGLKRMQQLYTDINLIVGGVHIRSHRIILASLSPYFEALLSPNMLEGRKDEIEIRELDGQIVQQLIDFAYTGTIAISHSHVQNILETANFLGIKLVQHECVKFIVKQIDSQNCMDIYNLGRQLGEDLLFKSSMEYLLANFVMISKACEFLCMPVEMMSDLLKSEELQFLEPGIVPSPPNQEQGILNAVLNYVSHNENKCLTALPKLLNNIRLPTLLSIQLQKLQQHALVKKSPESLAILLKATETTAEWDVTADVDVWRKPRNNKMLSAIWSRVYAGGGQLSPIMEKYDDSQFVPITASIRAMKIHIRRWDGRPVWGGYEVTHSNGYTVHHGGRDFGYEVHEFTLHEDEWIISLEINSGWLIDRITFFTSKGRSLGPYGGPGGSTYMNGAKDGMAGYLICTRGATVNTQSQLAVLKINFQWAQAKPRKREHSTNGSDYSDIDSGEADNMVAGDEMDSE